MDAKSEWTVVSLEIDNYEGNRNKRLETEHPTILDVTNAVKSLNNGSKSSMAIIGSDRSVLCVGGGPGNYYIQVTLADNKVFMLGDPTKEAHQVKIIIGSVRTPLPANLLVDERLAMIAVEKYFSNGTLAPSLNWVEG